MSLWIRRLHHYQVLQPRPRKLGLTAKLPKPKPRTKPSFAVNKSGEAAPALQDVEKDEEKDDAETVVDVSLQEESLAHNLLDPVEDGPEIMKDTHVANPASMLLSPPATSTSTSSTKAAGTPAFLKTSTALQDDLAGQLAQMAEQLKRNAMHFADSLEKDKGALKETEDRLDVNYDSLGKERIRLRDHRGKSKGTTWLVIVSIVVVLASFIVMLFIMRIT
jgi:SNARE protein 1